MVKINRIYTRTGDDGTTGLVGGSRAAKDSPRVSAYGELDELNSFLGQCRTLSEEAGSGVLVDKLARIQNEIFDIGSQLATPAGQSRAGMPEIESSQVIALERWIDELSEGIPELRSFVLPGGSQLNSALHIARSVCRRVERAVIALGRTEPVPGQITIYLNRLSDLLFAMARHESHRIGAKEYLWEPGAKR